MNRYKFFVLCCLLSYIQVGYGQIKLQKGYIKTEDHQEIHGTIKLESVKKLEQRVIIKPNGTNKESLLEASTIQSIYIGKNRKYLKVEKGDSRLWLQSMWRVGEIEFLRNTGNQPIFFYKKNGVLSELTNNFKKISLEAYRSKESNRYLLPNGKKIELPSQLGGFKESGNKRYVYDGELFALEYTYIYMLEELGGIRIDRSAKFKILNEGNLKHYSKLIAESQDTPIEYNKGAKVFQYAVLGTFAPKTNLRGDSNVKEYGVQLELRMLTFVPNFSIGFGVSQFEDFNAARIGCAIVPGFGKVLVVPTGGIPQYNVETSALSFRIGYHFFEGKNIRPFFALGTKRNKLLTSRDYTPVNPDFYNTVYQPDKLIAWEQFVGVGADLYLAPVFQFRVEGTYARNKDLNADGLNLIVSMGFWF